MKRVALLGNAGGGKSLLSASLSQAKKLPLYYQLDKLLWNPRWVQTPEEDFIRKHDAILKKEQWIIDGMASLDSIKSRLKVADTIIFIDHSLWIHYWWAAKRQFMCILK